MRTDRPCHSAVAGEASVYKLALEQVEPHWVEVLWVEVLWVEVLWVEVP